jgi:hypothetical protein
MTIRLMSRVTIHLSICTLLRRLSFDDLDTEAENDSSRLIAEELTSDLCGRAGRQAMRNARDNVKLAIDAGVSQMYRIAVADLSE